MRNFNNPLDNIRIASPCTANWDEMFGDDRRRFCAACKLNVYNLSDMTRLDAENLLISSEGRLCVRFFKRPDGTVLTSDCPVGLRAVKTRTARVATAFLSMVIGLVSGVLGFRAVDSFVSALPLGDVPEPVTPAATFEEVQGQMMRARPPRQKARKPVVGRIENMEQMSRKTVVAWVK